MDRDPAWPPWDSAELLVASDSARVARYRLHQSWYREHVLGVGPGERHGNRTALVGNTLDPSAERIDRTICEITPTDALQDRTAFDAMIRYTDNSGIPRFVGIETKYTEPFSPTKYDNPHYRAVTEASDWFLPGAADALVAGGTNQLWRGLMLASLTEELTGATGRYAVVAPADDTTAAQTVDTVRASLTDPTRLQMVTLEQIVNTAEDSESNGLRQWARDFRERYLRVG